MDVGTLILLGASGGLLRGLLDAYVGFSQWHAARREHRQGAVGPDAEVPVFQDYVDPVADSVAAVVHSALVAPLSSSARPARSAGRTQLWSSGCRLRCCSPSWARRSR